MLSLATTDIQLDTLSLSQVLVLLAPGTKKWDSYVGAPEIYADLCDLLAPDASTI